jgi:hypothetical protein
MQRTQFRAKNAKNDLKPMNCLKRNFYFETEGVITYNSKQIQIFSRTLEIRVQSSQVLPTQVSKLSSYLDSLRTFEN